MEPRARSELATDPALTMLAQDEDGEGQGTPKERRPFGQTLVTCMDCGHVFLAVLTAHAVIYAPTDGHGNQRGMRRDAAVCPGCDTLKTPSRLAQSVIRIFPSGASNLNFRKFSES